MQGSPTCASQPNVSLLLGKSRREPLPDVVEMYLGWAAARNGEPLDQTQPADWVMGFRLWHRVQVFGPTPMPRVFPRM